MVKLFSFLFKFLGSGWLYHRRPTSPLDGSYHAVLFTCSFTAALNGASCASISVSPITWIWSFLFTFDFLDPHKGACSRELSADATTLRRDREKLLLTIPAAADTARSSGFIRIQAMPRNQSQSVRFKGKQVYFHDGNKEFVFDNTNLTRSQSENMKEITTVSILMQKKCIILRFMWNLHYQYLVNTSPDGHTGPSAPRWLRPFDMWKETSCCHHLINHASSAVCGSHNVLQILTVKTQSVDTSADSH